jgi:hypothetical protein
MQGYPQNLMLHPGQFKAAAWVGVRSSSQRSIINVLVASQNLSLVFLGVFFVQLGGLVVERACTV